MIANDLLYNAGDYVIDDEAEEIEDAMQDLIEDEGTDIDRVAELSDIDYDNYEENDEDEEDDYDEDYVEYSV